MREMMARYATERKLVMFFGLILGFTLLGPFGTYESLGLWERLIFWSLIFTGIGAVMHVAIVLALEARFLARLPRVARIAIGSAVAALPGAALVIFLIAFMYDGGTSSEAYPVIWAQVAAIGTLVGFVEFPPSPAAILGPAQTSFHDRLPKDGPHDIVSLTMNDHYVEVTTTDAKHMVLMRFADALEELSGADGLRLHRSHWADRRHLTALVRREGKPFAVLSDGRELPVSKSYLDAVAAVLPDRSSGAAS